jgi:hypothetical protein
MGYGLACPEWESEKHWVQEEEQSEDVQAMCLVEPV